MSDDVREAMSEVLEQPCAGCGKPAVMAIATGGVTDTRWLPLCGGCAASVELQMQQARAQGAFGGGGVHYGAGNAGQRGERSGCASSMTWTAPDGAVLHGFIAGGGHSTTAF